MTPTVPTQQTNNQIQKHSKDPDPLNEFAREFGRVAGHRIGNALAEEIHEDPEVRQVAAIGVGVGVGVVVGLEMLALATQ